MLDTARTRSFSLCALMGASFLLTNCTLSSPPSKPTLTFESVPSDMVLASGEHKELSALAKSSSGDPVTYTWEKLQGTSATHVSNKATLILGADGVDAQCGAPVEIYRVIANSGALRAEKTFSVKAQCDRAPLVAKSKDALTITPEHAWLSPGEKLTVSATTRLKGATLKWQRISSGEKIDLSSSSTYIFEAPPLDYPCETKEFSLMATVIHGDAEDTKTMSIRVQNKACILDTTSGLTSNDTTRLLIASDDSVFIGTKNGLTLFKGGKTTKFFTAKNNAPLEIITALAEVDSKILVGKAKRIAPGPLVGLGVDVLHVRGENYFWESAPNFPNAYIPFIQDQVPRDEAIYASVDHRNQSYFGGDGGVFVFKNGKQLARFDGSQWNGKAGLFGISSNRSVRAMARDQSGNIWIGLQASTFEKGGLLQFRPSSGDGLTGKWNGPSKLPQGQDVRALAIDAGNNLWIATDNGLTRRNTAGVFRTYGPNDGLPSVDIRDVAYHAETGNLWIATSAGVARWSLPQQNPVTPGADPESRVRR